ncbi:hypothetical protein DUNSADRAFT_18068 [Dunaliella salina]|uniref:Secreted peptide n=1 Tax=Dunaliella salina TaxID=3046 RepID=A0ABQ7GZN9_DUNSA|nr:hypothetical protein DUNSADRAFT_18068 [Dunaliella salina]|eukprot:KAF5840031.1 hypothetical protein DUNSADRAFT_18068 [Dunaliella salina]
MHAASSLRRLFFSFFLFFLSFLSFPFSFLLLFVVHAGSLCQPPVASLIQSRCHLHTYHSRLIVLCCVFDFVLLRTTC